MPNTAFKEAFEQVLPLLKPSALCNILIHEMNTDLFNMVLMYGSSSRGTDGLFGVQENEHYIFENFFAYIVAQLIFVILDGVIALEKHLRYYSGETPTTRIRVQTYPFIFKLGGVYALRIPRYQIFQATQSIDYYTFYDLLTARDKNKLDLTLNHALAYIDVCRECFNKGPINFSIPFANQGFCRRKTQPLYFEMTDRVRIITSYDDEDESSNDVTSDEANESDASSGQEEELF